VTLTQPSDPQTSAMPLAAGPKRHIADRAAGKHSVGGAHPLRRGIPARAATTPPQVTWRARGAPAAWLRRRSRVPAGSGEQITSCV